jgi:hypothetical protein
VRLIGARLLLRRMPALLNPLDVGMRLRAPASGTTDGFARVQTTLKGAPPSASVQAGVLTLASMPGTPRSLQLITLSLLVVAVAAACGEDEPSRSAAPSDEPSFPPRVSPYDPAINPDDFVEGIDNPYMPFEPGAVYVYEGVSEDEEETVTVSVTNRTREILGITATVVKDVVTVEGEIAEKTFDWFAQDRYGNVWYLGEDSKEYEDGKPVSSEGSWEAGVDGAQPGIVMLGDPQVGDRYRQEYYEGEAEDFGKVIKLNASIEVPYDSYTDVLVTEDWNPLEPKILENKYYARGVGVVYERSVKGPKEELELVDLKQV